MKEINPISEEQKNVAVPQPQSKEANAVESSSGDHAAHDFSQINIFADPSESIQPKLKINAPGDRYEIEADRMAEQVMQMPQPMVQRKCATCGHEEEHLQRMPLDGVDRLQRKCSKCEAEEEEHLQRKANGASATNATPNLSAQLQSTRGRGSTLDQSTRSFMEPRFGADFGKINIHNDAQSAQMSQQINAKAFTIGQDIYFNRGQFDPNSISGKKLLAHELTHTLQQGGVVRRMPAETTAAPARTTPLLVDENTTAEAGQMKRSIFLRSLQVQVCSTVNQELQGTSHTADNCPYIKTAFTKITGLSASSLEALLNRYQPGASTASSASNLISLILARVKRAVKAWKKNENLAEVPENISGLVTALSGMSSGSAAGAGAAAGSSVSFKAKAGGAQANASPSTVMQNLGKGRALRGDVRTQMEGAFGTSFAGVEIHTDSNASKMSGDMNARAFAVGNHIAFNSGQYQPGTLVGDALLAHELAHVAQQQHAVPTNTTTGSATNSAALENDADLSAVNAVIGTRLGVKDGLNKMGKRAFPSLRSGLQLQRCAVAPAVPLVLGAGGGATAAGTFLGLTGTQWLFAAIGVTAIGGTAVVATRDTDIDIPTTDDPPVPVDPCHAHMIACMGTALNDKPGSVWGEGRCAFCAQVCRRRGGVWPTNAPTAKGGSARCDYWSY